MTALKITAAALLLALSLGACEGAVTGATREVGSPGSPAASGPAGEAPTTPAKSQSCPDWTLSRGNGVDAATFSDAFYWGRTHLGTAFCGDDSPNSSVAGRLESVAGGKANETTLLKVMEGRTIVRVWLVIHLDNGRLCTGSLDGSGNADCVMEVVPNDDGSFTIDDLPVIEDEPPLSNDPQAEADPYTNPDVEFTVSVNARSGCFSDTCDLRVDWRWFNLDTGEYGAMPEGATLTGAITVGSIPGFEFVPSLVEPSNVCHWSGTIGQADQSTFTATAPGCDLSKVRNLAGVWEGYWERIGNDGKQEYFGYCVGNSCRYENRR